MLINFLVMGAMVLLTSCGFELVDDGHVGIKKVWGEIERDEYPPGIHFYNPISSGIFEMETREKHMEVEASSYTADNQVVEAKIRVNYRPDPTMMAELYINQGRYYMDVLLPQRVLSATKEILGKYQATNLVQMRERINAEVTELLRQKLEGTNLQLVAFEVTNFDFDDDFEDAVKAKVVAKERAVEEENRTVQIREQAKQKVATAEADAEAIRIRAEALSRNKDLIQLEAVKKWDGNLPRIMTGDSVPFLMNIDGK